MRKQYSNKQKKEAVSYFYNGKSVEQICVENNIPRSTLYSWIKIYKADSIDSYNFINGSEFAKMKSSVEVLKQKIEVLQKVNCTYSSPLKIKLNELEKLYGEYSVYILSDALGVARGTIYNHVLRNKKDNNSYQFRRTALSEQILKIYHDSNQIYGAKKIKAVLDEMGIHTSDRMVTELMNEMNISSVRSDSKRIYRQLNKKKKDTLNLNFTTDSPNQIWVSDITYFKLQGKTYYICVIVDLFSRRAISYRISNKMSTHLVTHAFRNAYNKRQPANSLTFHSDQGSQYTSFSFCKLLKSYNIKQSFSPSGRPCHNAVMESFFSSMKKEELYRTRYHSENEFKKSVDKYIDFYNTKRPHATLCYKTPEACERLFFEKNMNSK